jgi:hypothetical protein
VCFRQSNAHSEERAEADEEAVLQQIEERAKRYPGRERSFRYYEGLLDRVLSDNALEMYRKDRYSIKTDSDFPFLLLTDLTGALSGLKTFKDRLPNRYQANINKVLDHADAIKQIFRGYRVLRGNGQGRGLHDVEALLTTLDELRKIDPDRFPADLVDVTDEEREQAMWRPVTRGPE